MSGTPYRGHVREVYLPICSGDITPCLMSREGSGLEGGIRVSALADGALASDLVK